MSFEFLPVGSVVLLHDAGKRLMICGRCQEKVDDDHIYDYVGCFYPEGIWDPSQLYFFDHSLIEEIHHVGLQDEEELTFRSNVLTKINSNKL